MTARRDRARRGLAILGVGALMASVVVMIGAAPDAAAAPCTPYATAVSRGTVAEPELAEASGIAAGRVNPQVVWVHADSGTAARLFALDGADASVVAAYDLTGATNVDWEDIAVGPGPIPGQSYVYVADIGGNNAAPAKVVYRVPEPVVDPADGAGPHPLGGVVALPFTYPASGAPNAETLLSDPLTGDLFVVTKALGPSIVYRYPAPQTGATVELAQVASLSFPLSSGLFTTGGDITPAGDEIAIRTYWSAFTWRRTPGSSIADALAGERCPVPLESEPQGEAVGYLPDGLGYLTLSERMGQGPQPLRGHVCEQGLTDVPPWVEQATRWITCRGHAEGYDDDTFRPRLPITRAQVATMLWGIHGQPAAPVCTTLTDIPDWARTAVCWLVDAGHATGYPDLTYRPDEPITRAQVANILWGIAGSPPPDNPCTTLTDIPTWAHDSICWLLETGHATGYPNHTFRPDRPITRAQVANMLWGIHGR